MLLSFVQILNLLKLFFDSKIVRLACHGGLDELFKYNGRLIGEEIELNRV